MYVRVRTLYKYRYVKHIINGVSIGVSQVNTI